MGLELLSLTCSHTPRSSHTAFSAALCSSDPGQHESSQCGIVDHKAKQRHTMNVDDEHNSVTAGLQNRIGHAASKEVHD
jgi:hypothetical protein